MSQVVAVDAMSMRLPSRMPAEQVSLQSFARDMPRAVPLGRWDCERDSFTPAAKVSTRFAGFMTGKPPVRSLQPRRFKWPEDYCILSLQLIVVQKRLTQSSMQLELSTTMPVATSEGQTLLQNHACMLACWQYGAEHEEWLASGLSFAFPSLP